MNGVINVYKEAGFTSHDVVAKLRGICKQKKIGHTGTLDPDAVGVLPVCLGSGTKLCDMLTGETKEYIAGGNDARAIQRTKAGVRVAAISAAVRYLHAPASVGSVADFENMRKLTRLFLERMAREVGE